MKQLLLLIPAALIGLLSFSPVSLRSQPGTPPTAIDFDTEIRIGLSAGLTKNYHFNPPLRLIDDPTCPTLDNIGGKWGLLWGIAGVVQYGERNGIRAHLLYSTHPGGGIQSLTSSVLLPSPDPRQEPEVTTQTVSATTELTYNLYSAGVLWSNDLLSAETFRFGVAVGGAVAHVTEARQTMKQELHAPENVRFINPSGFPTRDDGRVIVFADNQPIENLEQTRFSLRGGAYADLILFDRLFFTPGLYYDYGLTPVVSDSDWTVSAVLFQLDMTFRL